MPAQIRLTVAAELAERVRLPSELKSSADGRRPRLSTPPENRAAFEGELGLISKWHGAGRVHQTGGASRYAAGSLPFWKVPEARASLLKKCGQVDVDKIHRFHQLSQCAGIALGNAFRDGHPILFERIRFRHLIDDAKLQGLVRCESGAVQIERFRFDASEKSREKPWRTAARCRIAVQRTINEDCVRSANSIVADQHETQQLEIDFDLTCTSRVHRLWSQRCSRSATPPMRPFSVGPRIDHLTRRFPTAFLGYLVSATFSMSLFCGFRTSKAVRSTQLEPLGSEIKRPRGFVLCWRRDGAAYPQDSPGFVTGSKWIKSLSRHLARLPRFTRSALRPPRLGPKISVVSLSRAAWVIEGLASLV